jgi:hypothetical protein
MSLLFCSSECVHRYCIDHKCSIYRNNYSPSCFQPIHALTNKDISSVTTPCLHCNHSVLSQSQPAKRYTKHTLWIRLSSALLAQVCYFVETCSNDTASDIMQVDVARENNNIALFNSYPFTSIAMKFSQKRKVVDVDATDEFVITKRVALCKETLHLIQ